MPTMSALLMCFLELQGSGFNFGAASTPSTPAFGASNPIFGAANAGECLLHANVFSAHQSFFMHDL